MTYSSLLMSVAQEKQQNAADLVFPFFYHFIVAFLESVKCSVDTRFKDENAHIKNLKPHRMFKNKK